MKTLIIFTLTLVFAACEKGGAGGSDQASFNPNLPIDEVAESDVYEPIDLVVGSYYSSCSGQKKYQLVVQDEYLTIFKNFYTTGDCQGGTVRDTTSISLDRSTHQPIETAFMSFNSDLYYLTCGITEDAGTTVNIDGIDCDESWENASVEFIDLGDAYEVNGIIFQK